MIPLPFVPARFVFFLAVAMLLVVLFAIRAIQPAWWSSRMVRVAVFGAFGMMLSGLGIWAVGRGLGDFRTVYVGAGLAYGGLLVFFPAAVVTPVAAGVDRLLLGRAPLPPERVTVPPPPKKRTLTRRDVVRFGAGSLPAVAAAVSGSGLVTAKRGPTTPLVTMRYPGLHPDLDGLRILHLSDLHLGIELGLPDLERALAYAKRELKPDLVVLTGDLADDSALIGPALEMVHQLGARYGVLSSLGNHEYLHGIEVTRPEYEKSPVPLLCANGRTLRIGRAQLFVGGSDDPVHMGGDIAWFVRPSIEKALEDAPPNADFKLLLCHRPEGFEPASELGYDLTLSGHTHGGQLGFLGRSLLEKLRPAVHWWGSYAKKEKEKTSRLYTTSGFGHWFPFRLGCPTEMPLVVLKRG